MKIIFVNNVEKLENGNFSISHVNLNKNSIPDNGGLRSNNTSLFIYKDLRERKIKV